MATNGHETLRVAAVQWDMRRVSSTEEWLARVDYFTSVAAADYAVRLVLFPEYFSLPLLAAEPPRPARTAIRRLAEQTAEITAELVAIARHRGIWLVAGSQPLAEPDGIRNVCFALGPQGERLRQDKQHITPWEREAWDIRGGAAPELWQIAGVPVGLQICYDVEFPDSSCWLGDAGMELLLVPYCTDDRRGHFRVTRCAMLGHYAMAPCLAAVGSWSPAPASEPSRGSANKRHSSSASGVVLPWIARGARSMQASRAAMK